MRATYEFSLTGAERALQVGDAAAIRTEHRESDLVVVKLICCAEDLASASVVPCWAASEPGRHATTATANSSQLFSSNAVARSIWAAKPSSVRAAMTACSSAAFQSRCSRASRTPGSVLTP